MSLFAIHDLSTVFLSYQDDGRAIMTGFVPLMFLRKEVSFKVCHFEN